MQIACVHVLGRVYCITVGRRALGGVGRGHSRAELGVLLAVDVCPAIATSHLSDFALESVCSVCVYVCVVCLGASGQNVCASLTCWKLSAVSVQFLSLLSLSLSQQTAAIAVSAATAKPK